MCHGRFATLLFFTIKMCNYASKSAGVVL
jgi:hypothetical protein